MKLAVILSFAALSSGASVSAATLVGDTIDAAVIRTVDNGYGLGRVYGYGLEGPFTVVEGAKDKQTYSAAFELDVDGDRFRVQFIDFAGWQDGTVLRLSGLDFSGVEPSFLSSLTVDTNLLGYGLTVGRDFVDLGLGGTKFTADTYFSAQFNVAAVPEPSALLLGFAGALALAIRSKRSNAMR
jgi:hypothetical protein